jgi:hypothetical protein
MYTVLYSVQYKRTIHAGRNTISKSASCRFEGTVWCLVSPTSAATDAFASGLHFPVCFQPIKTHHLTEGSRCATVDWQAEGEVRKLVEEGLCGTRLQRKRSTRAVYQFGARAHRTPIRAFGRRKSSGNKHSVHETPTIQCTTGKQAIIRLIGGKRRTVIRHSSLRIGGKRRTVIRHSSLRILSFSPI